MTYQNSAGKGGQWSGVANRKVCLGDVSLYKSEDKTKAPHSPPHSISASTSSYKRGSHELHATLNTIKAGQDGTHETRANSGWVVGPLRKNGGRVSGMRGSETSTAGPEQAPCGPSSDCTHIAIQQCAFHRGNEPHIPLVPKAADRAKRLRAHTCFYFSWSQEPVEAALSFS